MIFRRIYESFNKLLRRSYVSLNTHHISGPRIFRLNDAEVCGILLGRNIAYCIPAFMEHYRELGLKYFVYIDNGSDDGSIQLMSSYDNVIVASNRLNFRDYQRELRFISATKFCQGGWRLAVDSDEILDYSGAPERKLSDLVQDLMENGYTGLIAQMLEMVPEEPIQVESMPTLADAISNFRSYSVKNVTRYAYHDDMAPLSWFSKQNKIGNPEISFLYGGLRRTLFGEDCCLTKHVLFRAAQGVEPLVHPHITTGLNCANFTVLLKHYKFSGDFLVREKRRLSEGRLSHNEAEQRLAFLKAGEPMKLTVPNMGKDPTLTKLVECGFLVMTSSDGVS